MPDLLAGTKVKGGDTPSIAAGRAVSFWSATITSYGKTTSAGTPPAAGFAFGAPTTGRIKITVSAALSGAAAGDGPRLGWELRNGGSVGAGTVVQTATDDRSIRGNATGAGTYSRSHIITGLTPNAAYNIDLMWKVAAGTGTFTDVDLIVEPCS